MNQIKNQKELHNKPAGRIFIVTLSALLALFITTSSFAALNVAPDPFHASSSIAALTTDASIRTAQLEKMAVRI